MRTGSHPVDLAIVDAPDDSRSGRGRWRQLESGTSRSTAAQRSTGVRSTATADRLDSWTVDANSNSASLIHEPVHGQSCITILEREVAYTHIATLTCLQTISFEK